MTDYRNISLEQYIKDAGLDTNPDYPVSRARGITIAKMETQNEEDDKDFVELTDDAVIAEMGMDTVVEDDTEGFRTIEQREQVKIPSQQWRLQPENVVNKKPDGMPPLIPKNSNFFVDLNNLYKKKPNQNNNFQNNNDNRRRRNWNNGNGGGGGGYNRVRDLRELVPRGSGNFYGNRNGNRFGNRNYNNRGFNNHNQPSNFVDFQHPIINMLGDLVRTQLDHGMAQMRRGSYGNQNCITELNPPLVPPSQPTSAMKQMQFNSTRIRSAAPPSTARGLAAFSPGAGVLKPPVVTVPNPQSAVANVNPNGDLLPTIGSALMGHIQTIQQNFGNKYDLQAQEEIAQLQGRCLLYRPPVNGIGEGVDTIDGSGIDAEFKPVATNVSMNQRFA